MAKILIDIGNTTSKVVRYVEGGDNKVGTYTVLFREDALRVEDMKNIESQCGEKIDSVALSVVGEVDSELVEYLKQRYKEKFLEFNYKTPIPIKNLYKTPETLGSDRLLAAIAASEICKGENVLVIDMGSAITIDFVNSKGEYLGGNISAGAQLRFKSLSESTKMLPLCEISQKNSLYASSTKEAIELGVINGIAYELEGYISRYEKMYDDLKIIFSGGDANYFVERIKNTIFVNSELVLMGLNKVVDYNVKRD